MNFLMREFISSVHHSTFLAFRIWYVYEHPTMHYFGFPRHTLTIIAQQDFDWVFLEIPVKNCIVEVLLTCLNILRLLRHFEIFQSLYVHHIFEDTSSKKVQYINLRVDYILGSWQSFFCTLKGIVSCLSKRRQLYVAYFYLGRMFYSGFLHVL